MTLRVVCRHIKMNWKHYSDKHWRTHSNDHCINYLNKISFIERLTIEQAAEQICISRHKVLELLASEQRIECREPINQNFNLRFPNQLSYGIEPAVQCILFCLALNRLVDGLFELRHCSQRIE